MTTTIKMPTNSDCTTTSLLDAIKMIRAQRAQRSLVGREAPEFYELWVAPDEALFRRAMDVVAELLHGGIGVKVTIHWPYEGTGQWAVVTSEISVVNGGL